MSITSLGLTDTNMSLNNIQTTEKSDKVPIFIHKPQTGLVCKENQLCLRNTTKKEYEAKMNDFLQRLYGSSTQFWNSNYVGHMNFDISLPHYASLLNSILFNQNNVAFESSGATSEMELELVHSICHEIIGYDNNSWGYVTAGGTIGNIEALWVARNRAQKMVQKQIEDGLLDKSYSCPNYVITSKLSHYSVEKACNLLGLHLLYAQPDKNGRINEQSILLALQKRSEEIGINLDIKNILAIVANAGTTENGSVDDIESILNLCGRAKLLNSSSCWLHIDAAFGGYFAYCPTSLSEQTRKSYRLFSKADSFSVDPHKCGFSPYPVGFFALQREDDKQYVDFSPKDNYIECNISSAWTVEGSRSGALISSAYFGHCILSKEYPWIMEELIKGAEKLKEIIGKEECFELVESADLSIVLFTVKEKKERMRFYSSKLKDPKNILDNKLTVMSTIFNDEIFFRCVIMDPQFVTYANDFVEKLKEEISAFDQEFEIDAERRFNILKDLAQECDTEPELKQLMLSGKEFIAYNGFEPSGRIHIAQAIVTVLNANSIAEAGGFMILYIADWFAMMNHKMGGDLAKIKDVGKYFIEVFKGAGLNMKKTKFIWASDYINQDPDYFPRVLDIAQRTTVSRIHKCCQIMGRADKDSLDESQHIYPCMQVADIFELGLNGKKGVDICQLGLDQRKANMLAREYAPKAGLKAPIILSHHMLLGLKYNAAKQKITTTGTEAEDKIAPGSKMSKSDPNSAIFMDDSTEEIIRKIQGAFCTDSYVDNPVYEYIRYICLRWYKKITLCGKEYSSYQQVEDDWTSLNKKQVKIEVAHLIDGIVDKVRQHFDSSPELSALRDRVAQYRVTR